jgi:hypothetical protein
MRLPGPVGFRNRRSIPWGEVPLRAVEAFRAEVAGAVAGGARLVSLFGLPEDDERTRLVAVLADDGNAALGVTSAVVGAAYPALTPGCPEAHLFEREIAEQCDVTPEGHPWLKPVRRHPPDHRPPRRTAELFDRAHEAFDREAYPFFRAGGDEVHEVAVGPVHAGVIEPGHFRFHAHGEDVLFLEIVLGYQHRGVERLLETLPAARAMLVAESIAGDTVIGHAEAYCGAIEALSRCRKAPRAQAVRGCALELERLANHIGDLGALAGDVAFAPTAAICGRVRGDVLNLLLALSGNRFGRGLVRPGGVGFDLAPEMADELRARLAAVAAEFEQAAGLFFGSESVQARLEGTGVVPAGSKARAWCRRRAAGSWASSARRLAPPTWRATCARTIRGASTASRTSRPRPRPPATWRRGRWCARSRCAARSSSCSSSSPRCRAGSPCARRRGRSRRTSWWWRWRRAGAARSRTWA